MTFAEDNILKELGKLDRQRFLSEVEYWAPGTSRKLAERMFAIASEGLPPDHPKIAECARALASEMLWDKEFEPAIALLERAVAIYRAANGELNRSTIQAEFGLADAYWDKGDVERARAICRETVEKVERLLGADHAETRSAYLTLGGVLGSRGDIDGAIQTFKHLITLTERHEGPDGRTTATFYGRLAALFEKANRFDEALPLRQRVLAHYEARGAYEGMIAHALDAVAIDLAELGDLDQAEACNRRSIALCESSEKPNPETLAVLLKTQALILRKRGHAVKAQATVRRALDLLEQKDKWSLDKHRSGFFETQRTRPYTCVLYDELNALLRAGRSA